MKMTEYSSELVASGLIKSASILKGATDLVELIPEHGPEDESEESDMPKHDLKAASLCALRLTISWK